MLRENSFFELHLPVIFGVTGGVWALNKTLLDDIPHLGDVQVIVYTDWRPNGFGVRK